MQPAQKQLGCKKDKTVWILRHDWLLWCHRASFCTVKAKKKSCDLWQEKPMSESRGGCLSCSRWRNEQNISGSARNSFNQHVVVMQQSMQSFATQRQLYAVALKRKLSTQTLSASEWMCLVQQSESQQAVKLLVKCSTWAAGFYTGGVSPYAFTEHYPICWSSPETDSRAVKTYCVLTADERVVTRAEFKDNAALRPVVREISLWWSAATRGINKKWGGNVLCTFRWGNYISPHNPDSQVRKDVTQEAEGNKKERKTSPL